jgi:amidophosphoribosyltransferase
VYRQGDPLNTKRSFFLKASYLWRSEMDLAARQAINELEGENVSQKDLEEFTRQETEQYNAMEDRIRKRLNLTTLKYQHLEDLVEAIGLPGEKLCTYCWSGKEIN